MWVYFVDPGELHARRSCPFLRSKAAKQGGRHRRIRTPIQERRLAGTMLPTTQTCPCWRSYAGQGELSATTITSPQEGPISGAVPVSFTVEELRQLRKLAAQRHQEMKTGNIAYGISTPERQLAGLLGERGILRWLHAKLPSNAALVEGGPGDPDVWVRLPDGQGLTGIEVKTHEETFWNEHGRMVSALQLGRMHADVIAWCCTVEPVGTLVRVLGWSTVAEVRKSGEEVTFRGHRNVRVHAPLQSPDLLVQWLAGGRQWPPS